MSRDSLEFKSSQAQHLLDDPILNKILTGIEIEILDGLAEENLLDYGENNIKRDRLVLSLQQIRRFRIQLKRIVNAGKITDIDELTG